ncbi:MAG: beta-ketoacyl-ACP synthase II [Chlorobi bacterium]|nr:beta-ketoacyl-ACP synthase II [Chlorobiota bacterium]
MNKKRVVITGMGALTPIGNNMSAFKQNLFAGKSGAGPITKFDASAFKTRFACEVKDFNPADFLDRGTIRKTDHFIQYALVASDEAIADAGLEEAAVDKERVGVILGSGIGGLNIFQKEVEGYIAGGRRPRFSPFLIPKMIPDMASGLVSIKYGYTGPNYATVSACATSSHALIDAYHLILLGKADVIVTGGAESAITDVGVGGFSSMRAISTRNDDPETASRPFDKDRDGFVMGEGAGVLVVEDYEHAKKRGAKIYAEIVGAGLNADAYHMTAPHPEGEGAAKVMKLALQDAGLQPADIDYINVHGTSTPLGDLAEAKAILNVFGEDAYRLNISSTKSMTGHLLGAAGAVESIATILAINESLIPPTINHFTDDPEIDPKLNFTFNKAQEREVRYALNNTFGFGGHNTSVIFKKFE